MTDILSGKSMDLPGSELDVAKMPGHWLLARLGKRVLRPGGLKLTRELLDGLAIGPADEVVEFAPGLGVTARMILQHKPQRYTVSSATPRQRSGQPGSFRRIPMYRLWSAEPIRRACRQGPPPSSSARPC